MSNEFLKDRRVALEESFFAKQNEALRRKLNEMDEARSKLDFLHLTQRGIESPRIV